jgi:histidyl-tRNA synthetase
MERLVLLLLQKEQKIEPSSEMDLFIAGLGDAASRMAFSLMQRLRKEGVRVTMDLDNRGLKSQMKQADKVGARYVLMIGEKELAKNTGMLRNMATQEQGGVPLGDECVRMLMETTATGRHV